MTEVSAQVRRIVDEFSQMTGAMRDASNKVESAANVASQFLSQTDLSSISRGLDSILISLNGKITDLESQVRELSTSVQQKNSELLQVRTELDRLKSKVNAVPEKQRKKLGLL
jgi:ABC-type transporter Mla subunit MlaD